MSDAAIESATAQMANTSLKESKSTAEGTTGSAGGDKPSTTSATEAVSQSAAEGRRLYIGNLLYATTEAELKDFFKDYLVETVSIPVNPRTSRPVGYAFVDVSTPSEAERAVTELNGKSILDRRVSVQLARKSDDPTPAAEATEGPDGESTRRSSGRGRGRGRGGRGGRAARGGRGGPRNASATDEVAEGSPAVNGAPVNGASTPGGPTNVLAQVEATSHETGEAGTDGTTSKPIQNGGGAPRPPRQRGPPEDGIPSKTKIMVANLPYDLREDKLLEIFKDYSPTSAKLALRPIPRFMVRKLQARNEPRKGRGFAFVTLSSEEFQQKAIAAMNGKEIEGRELAVKVAIDSPGKEDDDVPAGKENGAPSTAHPEASVTTEAAVAAT